MKKTKWRVGRRSCGRLTCVCVEREVGIFRQVRRNAPDERSTQNESENQRKKPTIKRTNERRDYVDKFQSFQVFFSFYFVGIQLAIFYSTSYIIQVVSAYKNRTSCTCIGKSETIRCIDLEWHSFEKWTRSDCTQRCQAKKVSREMWNNICKHHNFINFYFICHRINRFRCWFAWNATGNRCEIRYKTNRNEMHETVFFFF